MAASRYVSYARAPEGATDDWYRNVEKAKEKARRFNNMIMGIDQKSSVIVGIVTAVDIDRLWQFKYPYCKVSMVKAVRFAPNGFTEANLGDTGVFWLNNPDNVLPLDELVKKYPRVHAEVQMRIKGGGW
ncbi:MAG: hypothetical protein V1887_03480 [Candidatus Aenigmatarchaeota archaeon]